MLGGWRAHAGGELWQVVGFESAYLWRWTGGGKVVKGLTGGSCARL